LHRRMTSQLVALATQARKASGVEALDELDERDDELPDPHMSMSARRQLPLPLELVKEVEVAKQVPHLAMMLSTAFTHIDDEDEMEDDGQPVRHKRDNITPAKARLMRHPQLKVIYQLYPHLTEEIHRLRFQRAFANCRLRDCGPRNASVPVGDCGTGVIIGGPDGGHRMGLVRLDALEARNGAGERDT
jgi:hypothetical protein